MDTASISQLCKDLLLKHNRVSLGNLGSFMAETLPASFTRDAHVLMPPCRRISFKTSETWNDGLLESQCANVEELHHALEDLSKKLKKDKTVELDGFGKLRQTKEGSVFFVMDRDVVLFPDGFGLVPLSLSPLDNPSKLKCATPTITPTPPFIEAKPVEKPVTIPPVMPVHNKKAHRWLVFVLAFLVLLMVFALAIYFFRDELRPLLERVLYSPQERSYL